MSPRTQSNPAHKRRPLYVCSLALVLSFALACSTGAQSEGGLGKNAYGARIGWDIDNDQFTLGVQAEFDEFVGPLTFAPSIDLGTGSDLTTYAVNGDFRLDLLSPPGSRANLYAGAGPSVVSWRPENGPNDTEIGISLVTGIKLRMGSSSRYNMELRFGVGDIPEARLMAGVLF